MGHFRWSNKLAPYTEKYRCADDCEMGGCPGHTAEFTLNSVMDRFNVKFHNQEINLDTEQVGLLLDFFERLSSKETL